MTEPSVEEAVLEVQRGVPGSYGVVVKAYQRRLRALVAVSCPPGIEADEIAHLAFVTAFREIGRYRLGTDFYAWLSTIARNLLLAEYKNVKRESRRRKDFLRYETTEALEETAGEPALSDRRMAALKTCTESLPEPSRALLERRYAQDASIRALSEESGASVSAMKVRLFSLRKRLRDCVDKRLALAQE